MLSSILISSYNRLPLLKRTLYSIVRNKPENTEVIIVDDASTDDILGELKTYSSAFAWTFVKFNSDKFTEKTGLKKYFNNPSVTNNIAFRQCKGDFIFQQGNEIIAWDNVYNKLIEDRPKDTENYMVMSTTYDVPMQYLSQLDTYGTNLSKQLILQCHRWPLQSEVYRSDVTNYISLASRQVWEQLKGYDERYFAGICAEDSDFVRRARTLENFKQAISKGVSLHQFHGGKTTYYEPQEEVIRQEKFKAGCAINLAIYHAWDGTHENKQAWDWGTYGIEDIIKNVK